MSSMFGMLGSNKRAHAAGEEAHNKKLKFDYAVKDKIDIVRDAVGSCHGRSDKCHLMLESMVPGSLGPGLDERDEIQTEVVEIVGKVIDEIQRSLEKNVDRKQFAVDDPVAARAALEREKADLEALVKKDEDATDAAEKALEDIRNKIRQAEDKLDEEQAKLDALKVEQEAKQVEKDAFDDAYKTHFLPLKNNEVMDRSEAQSHIDVLLPLFQVFAYEKSLLTGFKPAGLLRPQNREHFDVIVMDNAEKGFKKHMAAVAASLKEMEPRIKQAERAVQAAEAALEKLAQREHDAAAALGAARFKEWKDKGLLQDVIDELANFPRNPEEARQQLAAAKKALQDFIDGPRAAYEFLRDRVAALAHVDRLDDYMNGR